MKSEDLNYTIKRLVKGLGSSRKAARQGFAMTLTEITLLFETVSVEDIMKHMKELLVVTKSCSSQVEMHEKCCLQFSIAITFYLVVACQVWVSN